MAVRTYKDIEVRSYTRTLEIFCTEVTKNTVKEIYISLCINITHTGNLRCFLSIFPQFILTVFSKY